MEFWARWAHRALWHASLWHMHEVYLLPTVLQIFYLPSLENESRVYEGLVLNFLLNQR